MEEDVFTSVVCLLTSKSGEEESEVCEELTELAREGEAERKGEGEAEDTSSTVSSSG